MVNKNIIYIKTPKCGSTSVQQELIRYGNHNNMKVLNNASGFKNEYKLNSGFLKRLSKTNIFSPIHNNSNYDISLSHVTGTDDNINRLMSIMSKQSYILLSSVREPLSRLVSNYMGTPHTNWVKTEMGFSKWYLKNQHNNVGEIFKGIPQVFPDFWINDFLCNYLDVNMYDDNALDKYDFITISEHYEDSMVNLSKKLGFDFKVAYHNKTNGKKIIISDEIKSLYYKNNVNDYKLYDTCLKKYL